MQKQLLNENILHFCSLFVFTANLQVFASCCFLPASCRVFPSLRGWTREQAGHGLCYSHVFTQPDFLSPVSRQHSRSPAHGAMRQYQPESDNITRVHDNVEDVENLQRIITRVWSSSLLYEALQGASAHCLSFWFNIRLILISESSMWSIQLKRQMCRWRANMEEGKVKEELRKSGHFFVHFLSTKPVRK